MRNCGPRAKLAAVGIQGCVSFRGKTGRSPTSVMGKADAKRGVSHAYLGASHKRALDPVGFVDAYLDKSRENIIDLSP